MRACDLHHPLLGFPSITVEAGYRAVVLYAQQEVPPFQVEQGCDLPCSPLRAQLIPLELDTGALSGADQTSQLVPIQGRSTSPRSATIAPFDLIFMMSFRMRTPAATPEPVAEQLHAWQKNYLKNQGLLYLV